MLPGIYPGRNPKMPSIFLSLHFPSLTDPYALPVVLHQCLPCPFPPADGGGGDGVRSSVSTSSPYFRSLLVSYLEFRGCCLLQLVPQIPVNPMCFGHNAGNGSSSLPSSSKVNDPLALAVTGHLSGDSAYRSVPLWSLFQPFGRNWYLTILISVDLIRCMFSFLSFPPLLDCLGHYLRLWIESWIHIQYLAWRVWLIEDIQ